MLQRLDGAQRGEPGMTTEQVIAESLHMREHAKAVVVQPYRPAPDCRYAGTFVSSPDRTRSTSRFHSLCVNTAWLPSSPILTPVSVSSTSGQFSHSVHRITFISWP